MNDRFKFRVWDEFIVKMEYYDHFVEMVKAFTWRIEEGTKSWAHPSKFIDELSIMQCTGLKDKNGKLIYEGDVLKIRNNQSSVIWIKCGFDLERPHDVSLYHDSEKMEIIGNIHEHPELINPKSND